MITNLVTVSLEHIAESAKKCTEDTDTLIMYLQNNGDKTHEWKKKDIDVWIYDDIDD